MHYNDLLNKFNCGRQSGDRLRLFYLSSAVSQTRKVDSVLYLAQCVMRKWNGENILKQIVYSAIANLEVL